MKRFISTFIFLLLIIFIFCGGKNLHAVKIGSILTLTGDAASYGEMMKEGMELAKKEVLEKNILHGKKLKIYYEDSQFKPKLGISAYKKLVYINKVNAIVNIIGSAVAIPIVPLAEKDGIPILDALSTSPALNNTSNIYMRICPSDDYVGRYIVKWIKELNKTKIAILYMNDDWGLGIQKALTQESKKLKLKVILNEGINPGIRIVSGLITKIRIKNPDIIILVCRPRETVVILKTLRQNGILTPVIGTDNMVSNEILQLPGKFLNNTFYCVPKIDKSNKLYKEFEKKFYKMYKKYPNIVSAYAYTTLLLMCKAIGNVGLDKEKIINYIINNEHQTILGKLKFDKNGNMISPNYERFMFKGRKRVMIK